MRGELVRNSSRSVKAKWNPGIDRHACARGRTVGARHGLHFNYNSWWTSPVPYTEKDVLDLIERFRKDLFEPYGVSPDTFCIDMEYIGSADKVEGCIFCRFPAENDDEKNLLLYRGEHALINLNAYPYSNGHLMVAPYRHTANLDDLEDSEMLDLMHLVRRSVNLLKAAFHPDGFNVGVNMLMTPCASRVVQLSGRVALRGRAVSEE